MNVITITQDTQNIDVALKRSLQENFKIWFYQNRFTIFGTVSLVSQLLFIGYAYIPHVKLFEEEKVYEEIAFVSSVKIADEQVAKEVPAQGEIKETEKLTEEKEKEDPRIASAQNPYLVGATIPVDLSPDIKPEYPSEAKAKGIEGVVTLELVIGDEGKVLKATAVNKPLGHGLEIAAINAFKRKKYKPAELEGKPITVKVLVPVHFRLVGN